MNQPFEGIGQKVDREKYWKELTTDEQLERMRTIIREQEVRLNRLTDSIHVLKNDFGRHSHNNGNISVLYESGDKVDNFGLMPQRPKNPDEVYF